MFPSPAQRGGPRGDSGSPRVGGLRRTEHASDVLVASPGQVLSPTMDKSEGMEVEKKDVGQISVLLTGMGTGVDSDDIMDVFVLETT